MKLNLGIVPKLTLVFVIFAAVLLAGVGWVTNSRGQLSVQQEVTSELSAVAGEKQAAIEAWAADRQADIAAVAASPDVKAALAALAAAAPASTEAQTAHDRLLAALNPHVEVGHAFLALLVLDPASGVVLAATQPAAEGTLAQDRAYFINGKNGPYTENVHYASSPGAPAMTSAAPVRSDDGQLIGVLAGQLNLAQLNAIVSRRSGLHQTDDSFTVNAQGLFVTQPRRLTDPAALQRALQTEAAQACPAHQNGSAMYADYRGVAVFAVYRWLPERELCLVVEIDQSEAFGPARALGQQIVVIAILALLAAALVAIVLARTITRPILALRAGAARLAAGDLTVRLPATSGDELGQLAREFNRMAMAVEDNEAKLRERADQLTQANSELEAFSYSVSHDLRSPLRAIDGFSRILLEDYEASLEPDAQRYLNIVRTSTQHMGHLIDDLLSFSRLSRQSLTLIPVEPADIVRNVLTSLRAEQDGRQVEIIIGELPACRADPALLTQVYANLLGNALKYTRRSKTARVEIGCQPAEGGNVYFVKDNGAGFDMQYAQKLFGVFQRLHRAEDFEGTGVGLAIVQRIIARHAGRIWAEAAVDQGATFYFTLPAVERAEPAPVAAPVETIAQRVNELV